MEKKNYTACEVNLLIELVRKNKDVVENKKTDAAMISKKRKTWDTISTEFNEDVRVTKRNADQLSKKWKNLKAAGAKEIAEERRERKMTGGGHEGSTASATAAIVTSLVPSQIVPLRNDFDDDSSFLDVNQCLTMVPVNQNYLKIEELLPESNSTPSTSLCRSAVIPPVAIPKGNPTNSSRIIGFAQIEHNKKMEILKTKKDEEDAKWTRLRDFDNKKEEWAGEEHKLNVEILELQKKYWEGKVKSESP